MIDLAIVVEGATEEVFVRNVLKAYLKCKGIDVDPKPFQIGAGRSGCGGNVTIDELASDMHTCYEFHRSDAVTSLVDFYGFNDEGDRSPDQLVEAIQNKIREFSQNRELDEKFVFPYVQVHEFEGLLFSKVDRFEEEFGQAVVEDLQEIRDEVLTPEDINNGEQTAPSKRIRDLIGKRYRKMIHGPDLAAKIGLDTIRDECPRFNAWLDRIERLPENNQKL